jgi:DNA-binding CsgD family transcriptional regulator/PAS domain-containing protein
MIDQHDNLIGLIYDGVTDASQWNLALKAIAGLASAAGVGLGMQDMRTHEFRNLGAYGIDPGLHHTYRRLAPDNRVWQEIGRRRQPMTDQMVMPKGTFLRTELFADWFKPQSFQSVMAHPTLFMDSASSVLVAFRDPKQGEFESFDLTTIVRFAAHFGRALTIRLEQERVARELLLVRHVLDDIPRAIFLVDRALRLRHANAAGRTLLEAGKGVRAQGGRLALNDPPSDARLAGLAAEGRGGELHLVGRGSPGLIVYMHPSAGLLEAAGYMTVRIVDPGLEREPPTAARLRDRLGLTPRQAEVVAELAAGRTEAEAAEKLKLAPPTLHTHIRRVYERLDLRSRAELFALLAHQGFDATRR